MDNLLNGECLFPKCIRIPTVIQNATGIVNINNSFSMPGPVKCILARKISPIVEKTQVCNNKVVMNGHWLLELVLQMQECAHDTDKAAPVCLHIKQPFVFCKQIVGVLNGDTVKVNQAMTNCERIKLADNGCTLHVAFTLELQFTVLRSEQLTIEGDIPGPYCF